MFLFYFSISPAFFKGFVLRYNNARFVVKDKTGVVVHICIITQKGHG